MWASILKIIELILGFITKRKESNHTRDNKINIDLKNQKDLINKLIEEAHKTKNLEEIRKRASE